MDGVKNVGSPDGDNARVGVLQVYLKAVVHLVVDLLSTFNRKSLPMSASRISVIKIFTCSVSGAKEQSGREKSRMSIVWAFFSKPLTCLVECSAKIMKIYLISARSRHSFRYRWEVPILAKFEKNDVQSSADSFCRAPN